MTDGQFALIIRQAIALRDRWQTLAQIPIVAVVAEYFGDWGLARAQPHFKRQLTPCYREGELVNELADASQVVVARSQSPAYQWNRLAVGCDGRVRESELWFAKAADQLEWGAVLQYLEHDCDILLRQLNAYMLKASLPSSAVTELELSFTDAAELPQKEPATQDKLSFCQISWADVIALFANDWQYELEGQNLHFMSRKQSTDARSLAVFRGYCCYQKVISFADASSRFLDKLAAAPTGEPAVVPTEHVRTSIVDAVPRLEPAREIAYSQYKMAKKELGQRATYKEAYSFTQSKQETGDMSLPSLSTWSRYVREARAAKGEHKNQSRGNRAAGSRSIVRSDAI